MKLERRAEGASDRDQEILETREPASPEPTRLDAPEDPLRGMSDGEVLQRFEMI